MIDDIVALHEIKCFLEKNDKIISPIIAKGKKNLPQDENSIAVLIGILQELKEKFLNLNINAFMLDIHLYDLIDYIYKYIISLFNDYGFVNAYKLYDVFKIDIKNLYILLNNLEK